MDVRPAAPDELPGVMTVLDSGLLAVSANEIRTAIAAGEVLVAAEDGRVLGALTLDDSVSPGTRIEAIAVRRGRRGNGIGTELVRTAAREHDRLVAAFDARVRPFWASLGFDIEPSTVPGRYIGTLDRRDRDP